MARLSETCAEDLVETLIVRDENASVGDVLRHLVFEVHAALKRTPPDPQVIRELMWRAAMLKGQLRCNACNELTRYLNNLERRIGRAYESSPTPHAETCPDVAGRHAA